MNFADDWSKLVLMRSELRPGSRFACRSSFGRSVRWSASTRGRHTRPTFPSASRAFPAARTASRPLLPRSRMRATSTRRGRRRGRLPGVTASDWIVASPSCCANAFSSTANRREPGRPPREPQGSGWPANAIALIGSSPVAIGGVQFARSMGVTCNPVELAATSFLPSGAKAAEATLKPAGRVVSIRRWSEFQRWMSLSQIPAMVDPFFENASRSDRPGLRIAPIRLFLAGIQFEGERVAAIHPDDKSRNRPEIASAEPKNWYAEGASSEQQVLEKECC